MPSPAPSAPITAEQYLRAPFVDDGRRRELVEGEVVVTEPSLRHQRVVLALASALGAWTQGPDGHGEVTLNIDTAIGPRSVFAPDLQWYADPDRLTDPDARPQPPGDLVVEVRSPATWRLDIGIKRARYEALPAVAELWLVDTPARTVIVCRRSAAGAATFDVSLELSGHEELTSPLLPGLALTTERIFGDG